MQYRVQGIEYRVESIPGAWCCCLGSSVFQVEAPGLKTASLDAGSGGCSLHIQNHPIRAINHQYFQVPFLWFDPRSCHKAEGVRGLGRRCSEVGFFRGLLSNGGGCSGEKGRSLGGRVWGGGGWQRWVAITVDSGLSGQ